jgi:hypothetical protein
LAGKVKSECNIDQIDQAVLDYKSHRTSTRNEVIEGVTKQKSVRSLYDHYLTAKKEMQQDEKALERLGFCVADYPTEHVYVQ